MKLLQELETKLKSAQKKTIKSLILLSLLFGSAYSYSLPTDTLATETVIDSSQVAILIDTAETVSEDSIHALGGFSFTSLWRGLLGLLSLFFIAYLFSANRKAINWRTVGIGLAFQIVIAIGVLKVPLIQGIFDFIGKIFVQILEYTQAGSKFLFEGLVVDMDTFGFIFAFQVLPTIIFFSALTSVLFYLGIIQKAVKAFGWLLTKLMHISGAESLSVAGNIFLGQTEAPLLIKVYLEKMNKSEILLVMIGGMATVRVPF